MKFLCKNCNKYQSVGYLEWCRLKMCIAQGENSICQIERYIRVTRETIRKLKEQKEYLQKQWEKLANFQLHVAAALEFPEGKDLIKEIERLKKNEKVIQEWLGIDANGNVIEKEEENGI